MNPILSKLLVDKFLESIRSLRAFQTCSEPMKNFKFVFPSLEEHFRFLAGLTDFRIKQVVLHVRHEYDNRTSAVTWCFEEGQKHMEQKEQAWKHSQWTSLIQSDLSSFPALRNILPERVGNEKVWIHWWPKENILVWCMHASFPRLRREAIRYPSGL